MKELRDQLAHVVLGFIIMLLVVIPYGPILSGLLIGLTREEGQHGWKIFKWKEGSRIDILFWVLSGVLFEIFIRNII